jgi:predicted SAM-dependent methyltransferase
MRLNVGCGNRIEAGYVNCDIRPGPGIDVVCSIMELSRHFDADSADEIMLRHVLEHVSPDNAQIALKEFYKVLKPGGHVRVIVPDIIFHARQLLGLVKSTAEDQRRHAYAGLYGWRRTELGGDQHDAHHWGYDERELTEFLTKAGFQRLHRSNEMRVWHLDMRGFK